MFLPMSCTSPSTVPITTEPFTPRSSCFTWGFRMSRPAYRASAHMSSSGTKYSCASNMRPTSTMPETRPLKIASLASIPSLSTSFAPSFAPSSSYWITDVRSLFSSSFFFSSVAIGLPPVIIHGFHHRLEVVGRHRGPDVAPGPDRGDSIVEAFLDRRADQVRRSGHEHVVGIVVPEDEGLGAQFFPRLGHVVLLVHADRLCSAFGHEGDDIVRLAADVDAAAETTSAVTIVTPRNAMAKVLKLGIGTDTVHVLMLCKTGYRASACRPKLTAGSPA